jgi:signal transduction histidine kinase
VPSKKDDVSAFLKNLAERLTATVSIAVENHLLYEELQDASRRLQVQNRKLRELDKTKDEFISMASHQLRTPLTTVKGYLSMILEGDAGAVKKDQKELMQHAFDGANRMVYLIADLLNVSRLQTGKFVIDNKPTQLAEVVSSETSQLNEQAANREVKLTYHKPDSFPVLNLDETKIRQVVMNFLDNALYYTPKGGSVSVDLQATDKEVSYTVSDTGVGVPKEVQHHLFSKFYRADNARKMRPDGTGLGLYMAKKVIAAQGGAIIFKSTEGKGSVFGFSFPRRAMEAKEAATEAKKEDSKTETDAVKTKA